MKLGVVEHSTAEQDGHVARRSDRLQEFTLNRHWIARSQWPDELAADRFVAFCNEGDRLAGCDDGRHLPSSVSDRWSEPHRYGSNDCEGGYCGDGICDVDENFENCPQDCEGDPEPGGPLNLEATGGDHQISLNWDEPVGLLSDRDESLQILVNNIIDDGAGNVILQLHMANSEPIVAFNFTLNHLKY